MTFLVTILENDDDLSEETIAQNLDGFELEFDASTDNDGDECEVKVLLTRVK